MQPYCMIHGLDQFLRVVSNTIAEHDSHLLDIGDLLRWIAIDHYQVRRLALRDSADPIRLAQILRRVQSVNANRLSRSESRLHQQHNVALIGEPRQRASVATRIRARHQLAACFHESVLELHFLLERRQVQRIRVLGG